MEIFCQGCPLLFLLPLKSRVGNYGSSPDDDYAFISISNNFSIFLFMVHLDGIFIRGNPQVKDTKNMVNSRDGEYQQSFSLSVILLFGVAFFFTGAINLLVKSNPTKRRFSYIHHPRIKSSSQKFLSPSPSSHIPMDFHYLCEDP